MSILSKLVSYKYIVMMTVNAYIHTVTEATLSFLVGKSKLKQTVSLFLCETKNEKAVISSFVYLYNGTPMFENPEGFVVQIRAI